VTTRRSPGERITTVLVAVVVALLLGACSPADPETRLSQAVETTLVESFTYTAEIEGEATGGGAMTEVGAMLRGLGVDGIRSDEAWSLRVGVLGFDILELRSTGGEVRHLQLGLGRVLSMLGGPETDPSARLVEELERRGVSPGAVEVVREGMRGEWLTIEGPIDPEELDAALGGRDVAETDRRALIDVLGGDIRGFIDDYVVVLDVEEEDGREVFRIEVETAAIARALDALDGDDADRLQGEPPEKVPGTVTVRDGRIEEIVLEVGDEGGAASRVVIRLSDHGQVAIPEAPERATVVDAETFLEALHALADLFAETGSPLPGG
jgi:hypothetical protein